MAALILLIPPTSEVAHSSSEQTLFNKNEMQKSGSHAIRSRAEGDEVKLSLDAGHESYKGIQQGPTDIENLGPAPIAYDPDEDPAFQKALRGHLMNQDLPQFFNPDSMVQAKDQTFGLQNPCAAEEGDALDDCVAEQECTPAGGGEGVYMDVVAGNGDSRTAWGEPMCVSAAEAESGEEIIELPTFTLQDFKTLNVAPAVNAVQPSPDTLKGMNTNVYAEAQPQQFATELGGFPVQVRAVPVQYSWDYGDGTALGPTELSGTPLEPGAWDVETDTSHVYTGTGSYAVALTTWFYGEYSIAGGPWLPVAGLNDVASAPVPLNVWKSTVRNYADNCSENSQGAGC